MSTFSLHAVSPSKEQATVSNFREPRRSFRSNTDSGDPCVTVGIRYHDPNRGALLERCLTSVGAQTDADVHIIVAVQDFGDDDVTKVSETCEAATSGTDYTYEICNVRNPEKLDLRARLLNTVVEKHYNNDQADLICFIDYDDIWFQSALKTLISGHEGGRFALSYADIHCADVFYDADQVYLRNVRDVFGIKNKTKRQLLTENFLPLHSYMFNTAVLPKNLIQYDENFVRLEDYDVLLGVARDHPVSGLFRDHVIGLYNFYSTRSSRVNTTANIFTGEMSEDQEHDEEWKISRKTLNSKHGGKTWRDFCGEEWRA